MPGKGWMWLGMRTKLSGAQPNRPTVCSQSSERVSIMTMWIDPWQAVWLCGALFAGLSAWALRLGGRGDSRPASRDDSPGTSGELVPTVREEPLDAKGRSEVSVQVDDARATGTSRMALPVRVRRDGLRRRAPRRL